MEEAEPSFDQPKAVDVNQSFGQSDDDVTADRRRISQLEELCSAQKEEISRLQNDVSDILKRLAALEAVKPAAPSTKKTAAEPLPRARPKLALSNGVPSSKRVSHTGSISSQGNRSQASFIKGDGIVRVYLRGRPIPNFLPTDRIESYDIEAKIPAPEEKLSLEWVYGYRGRDCRDNIALLPTGEIVYFVASVAVLYNFEGHSQRHYLEHTDDIKAMAVHADGVTVATGQSTGHDKKAGKAHVRIWNAVSLETMHVLGIGEFERAISCLGFSKADGGELLAVVDESSDHVLSVWEWRKGKRLTRMNGSGDPTLMLGFSPVDNSKIVTCGKNHVNFWTLDGAKLSKKSGVYGQSFEKPKITICMAFSEAGDLVTGDSNGNVFVWPQATSRVEQALAKPHDGGVFSLCFTRAGHLLSGGGKDFKVVEWDAAYTRTGVEGTVPDAFGPVRAIMEGPGGSVLVGTTRNTILQASGEGELSFSEVVVMGHTDDFWGLAMHPNLHQFVSAGTDCQVSLWDALARRNLWTTKVGVPVQCCAFHPAGGLVALGAANGKWLLLDVTSHEVIAVHADASGEQIQCIAYSPDGEYLALGAKDNYTYVYKVLEGGQRYSKVGRCSAHSSSILHLDWSADSQVLRTQSADYEVLYWTATDCKQVTSASSLRDLEWATHTVCLGWDVIGIWPEGADGTDINACCKANGPSALLATADDFGKVNLMQYPACTQNTKRISCAGHSSHVTNVTFLFDDSRVITTGGLDTAVMQWSLS